MKDILTEMLIGETGAFRCGGKFIVMPTSQRIKSHLLTAFCGAIIVPENIVLPENEYNQEMWECELIIIPKRKYSGKGSKLYGWKIGDMLTGAYGDPEQWGRKYFDSEQALKTESDGG